MHGPYGNRKSQKPHYIRICINESYYDLLYLSFKHLLVNHVLIWSSFTIANGSLPTVTVACAHFHKYFAVVIERHQETALLQSLDSHLNVNSA